jgi:hypothetical protein
MEVAMEYRSTTYITRNDDGEEEVEIEYGKTFFQWLFKRPSTKETYVGGGTVWYSKHDGYQAGTTKAREICNIVERHLRKES